MIASYDTIMKPPYEITSAILRLVSSISEKIGEVNAVHLSKPRAELRKQNRIRTIQSSLEIEGNTLSMEQITSLINNERVIAPEKDIIEVQNAIKTYNNLDKFSYPSVNNFLSAHKSLMTGLVQKPGKFRTSEVGIMKGSQISHVAPPGHLVNSLVRDLFSYLKTDPEIPLIKSCVFHYEVEFIHPFADGNGRMGRLWQTIILKEDYPIFKFLPIESIIKERQKAYYASLSTSDKVGNATPFVLFMLTVLDDALELLLRSQKVSLTSEERIDIFLESINNVEFTRQDYLRHFKQISAATASRDLKTAIANKKLQKTGDKRTTKYRTN
ncbi:MAG: Fic family protein [Cytophagales bacterium]|nr:Fic family protein [Cytophagales bacterium]